MKLHDVGGLLLVVGAFILLLGFALPETIEHTATSCYTDIWGYRHCADVVASERNTWRPVTIAIGFFTGLVGLAMMTIHGPNIEETDEE